MQSPVFFPAAVLAALLSAQSGFAQATTFLSPPQFTAQRGQVVPLRLQRVLEGRLQSIDWSARESQWLLVRAAGTQANHDRPPTREGTGEPVIELVHAGVTLIGFDMKPRVEEWPAARLRQYAADRGNLAPPAEGERGAVYRVRRVESAKTLVRVRTADGTLPHSATAQSKTGQTVELRPLADPTALQAGADLPVRVYFPVADSGGTIVRATHLSSGKQQQVRTNPSGTAHFRIDAAGPWHVETHRAEPAADTGADWVVYSATLTFAVEGERS